MCTWLAHFHRFQVCRVSCVCDRIVLAAAGSIGTGSSACTGCPAGQSSPGGGTTCTTCASGQYTTSVGAVCTACVAGQYTANPTVACSDCPPGKYQPAPSAASCTQCPAGQWSLAGLTACTACLGEFSEAEAACWIIFSLVTKFLRSRFSFKLTRLLLRVVSNATLSSSDYYQSTFLLESQYSGLSLCTFGGCSCRRFVSVHSWPVFKHRRCMCTLHRWPVRLLWRGLSVRAVCNGSVRRRCRSDRLRGVCFRVVHPGDGSIGLHRVPVGTVLAWRHNRVRHLSTGPVLRGTSGGVLWVCGGTVPRR